MASRKDYEAEAASIAKYLVPVMSGIELGMYIGERADYYEKDNPDRFDRVLFALACVDAPLVERTGK